MNKPSSTPGVSSANDPLSSHQAAPAADVMMRRRLLLRGATGGAAALAALKPVGALATSGTSTVLVCKNGLNKTSLCTLSGVQSAAHSFGPNIQKIQAAGKRLTYWSARTGATSSSCGTPNNAWPKAAEPLVAPGNKVSTLLSNSTYANVKMLDLLNSQPSSDEAQFIVAYLNATSHYNDVGPTSAKSFPYSKSQVQSFWNPTAGLPADSRARARTLFESIATLTS